MATNTPFGQRLGLVLEGGAMRGIYTAGVLDVFLEAGIMPDVVVGVSAGALHGCSYVAGQKGRSIRYYRKYRSDNCCIHRHWYPHFLRVRNRPFFIFPDRDLKAFE